jgi:tRNA(fMet)-specific endonuclease VapC
VFLLDTDILSDLIKREPSPRLIRHLAMLPPEQQYVSAISMGELIYGAYRSDRSEYFLQQLDTRVWPSVTILPFDKVAARVYGRIRAELERSGRPRSEPDLQIAASALANDLTLMTANVRHFEHIPGFRVENWL